MNRLNRIYAPGARIVVRDAEWLVRRVDRTSTGGQALNVIGIKERQISVARCNASPTEEYAFDVYL